VHVGLAADGFYLSLGMCHDLVFGIGDGLYGVGVHVKVIQELNLEHVDSQKHEEEKNRKRSLCEVRCISLGWRILVWLFARSID
jgi:hypothetical protein